MINISPSKKNYRYLNRQSVFRQEFSTGTHKLTIYKHILEESYILVMSMYWYMNVNFKKTQLSWLRLLNILATDLERGKTSTNVCPVYDSKPSDGKTPVLICPVGLGYRIPRLHLCRWDRPPAIYILYMTLNNLMVKLQSWVAQSAGGCRIHQLHLCRGVKPPPMCLVYDSKPSDGKTPFLGCPVG